MTEFEKLCEIVAKLRAPGGCPWDREQTHESLLPQLIEEERAYPEKIREELPDRQAALKEATITAGQILQSLDGKLQPGGDWRMEVTDEFGHPLYIISVSAKYSQ
jgi:hypothetical protein